VAGGFTIVAGASAAGAFGASQIPEPAKNDLSADTVNGVLTKMRDALVKTSQDVDAQEQKIIDMLSGTTDLFGKDLTLFLAPKPALIEESKSPGVRDSFLPP
jgi:hypothetical protein